jgi:hypothetical protein
MVQIVQHFRRLIHPQTLAFMPFDISYSFPTALLEDVARFIEYIESTNTEVNPKGTIAGSHLMRLNERMSVQAEGEITTRTQERFFPNLFLVKILLLQAGVVEVVDQKKGKSLLKSTPSMQGFKELSPAEQYFFLVEIFMVECDWEEITDAFNLGRMTLGMLSLCASEATSTIRAGDKLIPYKRGDNTTPQNPFMNTWRMEPLVQCGEFFGWWITEKASEKEYKDYSLTTNRFLASSLTFTDFGAAILGVFARQRNFYRWNKAFRQLEFGEQKPIPGAPIGSGKGNFISRLTFGSTSHDDEFAFLKNVPYKKGEQFYEAFVPLLVPNTLTKTLKTGLNEPHKNRTGTHIFKVSLDAKTWRRIALSHVHTLDHLHNAIQSAFKLDDDHLYAFFMDGKRWSSKLAYWSPRSHDKPSANKAMLGELELHVNKKFLYLFDFGDEWHFDVVFEGVDTGMKAPMRPVVIESVGKAPQQYEEDWEEEEEMQEDMMLKIQNALKTMPGAKQQPQKPSIGTLGKDAMMKALTGKAQPKNPLEELQKNLTPEQAEHIYRETGIEVEALEMTFDQLPESEAPEKMTPLWFLDKYEEIHDDISSGGKVAKTGKYEQVIKDAISRAPDVPSLRNMLRNVYLFMGKQELVNKLDRETYELFPDYLFARLSYARTFFPAEPETAYKIMGGCSTLSRTFPKRKLFHYTEALNFYSFQAEYLAAIGNIDSAYTILDMMIGISPKHHSIKQTQKVIEHYANLEAIKTLKENLAKMMEKKANKAAAKKKKK